MVLAFAVTSELLLASAGLVSAIGGIIATYAATKAAKREVLTMAEEDCIRRLRELRAENEKIADELYQLRMKRPDA